MPMLKVNSNNEVLDYGTANAKDIRGAIGEVERAIRLADETIDESKERIAKYGRRRAIWRNHLEGLRRELRIAIDREAERRR